MKKYPIAALTIAAFLGCGQTTPLEETEVRTIELPEVIALQDYLGSGMGQKARQEGLAVEPVPGNPGEFRIRVSPLNQDISRGVGSPPGYEEITYVIYQKTGEIIKAIISA